MTIKMRLDTEGLRALIADNPELEVQIGQEVLNNIKRDVVHLQVDELVRSVLWGMVENKGNYYQPNYVIRDPKLDKVIDDVISKTISSKLEAHVATLVGKALEANVVQVRLALQAELVKTMQELLTPEMAQNLIKEKLFA